MAVLNSPGISPDDAKAAVARAKGELYYKKITEFLGHRVSHVVITGVVAWAAGLGLGPYHVSVPFLATWLLSWLGMEGLNTVASMLTRIWLELRKAAVLPVSQVSYNGDSIMKSLMGTLSLMEDIAKAPAKPESTPYL